MEEKKEVKVKLLKLLVAFFTFVITVMLIGAFFYFKEVKNKDNQPASSNLETTSQVENNKPLGT